MFTLSFILSVLYSGTALKLIRHNLLQIVDFLLCKANPGCVSSTRNKTQVEEQMRRISSESTEAEKKKKRTQYGIKEKSNPLLSLPIDLYQ